MMPRTSLVLFLTVYHSVRAAQSVLKSNSEIFENVISTPKDPDSAAAWDYSWSFLGISTFAHLQHEKCLIRPDESFDIAVLGCPFDTAVSYRPGARFGPRAIRAASGRQSPFRSFGPRMAINPYSNWAKVIDCGDIPVTPFDNSLALKQMQSAYEILLSRRATTQATSSVKTKSGKVHPRILTLGGDHSIALPALRALGAIYGTLFTRLDEVGRLEHTLRIGQALSPNLRMGQCFGRISEVESDGRMANEEGLIANGTSIHAGLRTRLCGKTFSDYDHDEKVGFVYIETDDIDVLGTQGIVDTIIKTVGTTNPVYLSIDIDVIDPGICPGTGTPESGGWTTREMRQIIRGLEPLRIVGGDIVEVSPPYDNAGETTALAASDLAFEMISIMVKNPGFEGPRVEIAEPRLSKVGTNAKRDEL